MKSCFGRLWCSTGIVRPFVTAEQQCNYGYTVAILRLCIVAQLQCDTESPLRWERRDQQLQFACSTHVAPPVFCKNVIVSVAFTMWDSYLSP